MRRSPQQQLLCSLIRTRNVLKKLSGREGTPACLESSRERREKRIVVVVVLAAAGMDAAPATSPCVDVDVVGLLVLDQVDTHTHTHTKKPLFVCTWISLRSGG